MTNEDFRAVLSLPASPEDIAALFTTVEGVSSWWGPTEGDATVGGTITTYFGGNGVNANRVLEAGPTRFVWQPVEPDRGVPTWHTAEWLSTRIEFELAASDVATELQFRHAGLKPQLACWNDCAPGWQYFLQSIQCYAETGTGTPFAA
jgi:uncharacterized protein YndB with AHSA1/START domain